MKNYTTVFGILAMALAGAPVQASLTGDTVTVACVAQLPAPNTDCVVGGGPVNVVVGTDPAPTISSGRGFVMVDVMPESIVLTAPRGALFHGATATTLTISSLEWDSDPTRVITEIEVLTSGISPDIVPVTFTDHSITVDFGEATWIAGFEPTVRINITPSSGELSEFVTTVSAASFLPPVAAGSLATAFAAVPVEAGSSVTVTPLPKVLDGISVQIIDSSGSEFTAELIFVGPTQVNLFIPEDVAPGTATLNILEAGEVVASGEVQVSVAAPGLFFVGDQVAAAFFLVVAPDGARSQLPVFADDLAPMPVDLGPEGTQVFVLLFGTGIRNATTVAATIGGLPVPVLGFAPQDEFVGLDQVNLGPLPGGLAAGEDLDVVLTVDGFESNAVIAQVQSRGETVVFSIPFQGSGGDQLIRGFYLSDYGGANLSAVTLGYSASAAGNYETSLTARLDSYDGPIIGSSQTILTSLDSSPTPVTYDFRGSPVPTGSLVTFTQGLISGPGVVFYDTGMPVPSPSGITQTDGTTPPLDTVRRNRVGVVITQQAIP